MSLILNYNSGIQDYRTLGGGKAYNLKRMIDAQIPVPEFIVISTPFFSPIKRN